MPKLIQAKKKTKAKARVKLIGINQQELDRLQAIDGLGPNQRALLKAARLKKYNATQCRNRMYDGKGYDFLGLACLLAGVEPEEVHPGIWAFGPKKMRGILPALVVKHYGFRSPEGGSNRGAEVDKITHMTDYGAWTLVKLSAKISQSPQRYFEKPL